MPTPDEDKRIAEVAKKMRELLLTLPDELRMTALHAMEFCRHCGGDEAGRPANVMPCQCWNDE